ncbi:MAG: cation-translocating P-type ATPase [Syntrophomonadaceae bacterium]|nr:cation-translocating P-type ATPase [Syntrophomonadaceae bacterium]
MKHHLERVEKVLDEQRVTTDGLTSQAAQSRLLEHGANRLKEEEKKSLAAKFLEQMIDPMIIVLIAASIISGVFGEIADMIIIMVVVLMNATLGVYQENKAEKAIEALQKMAAPFSRVRREGVVVEVKSEEVVPGDIVLIEAGDAVPADMRLIDVASLKTEESSLTGESVPVEKSSGSIIADGSEVTLGDRINMAYMGTSAVYGRGEGVVVATGMATEIGKIAGILSATEADKTPLQIRMAGLSKILSAGVLGICIFIFVFSVMQNGGFYGGHVLETFMLAISLAVAAIPEGLVVVVTVVLSVGVTRMSKRNAIIRRLTAVETLGCTEIICSDKTGTLTQNKMTVTETSGDPESLVVAMALCNDVQISPDNEVLGEPTECALTNYALQKQNITLLKKNMPRRGEAPFDSVRKMMSTVHENPSGGYVQFTKGAPDEIIKICTHIVTPNGIEELTEEWIQEIGRQNHAMAEQALRVLGFATRLYEEMPASCEPDALERGMTFIGLSGMIDPIRPEALAAINTCRKAGIRPVMITGDHKDTATAIARELGIITDAGQVITGAELSLLSDKEFADLVVNYSVYARVQPEHKVRIVNAWKKRGKITAMTGDGVNDAPAMKSADIGVGMGITGTDVTKNVADMVLADDNFASIVYAVEEGRRIYDNIRKVVQFLLASNLSEVVAIFIAMLFNVRLFAPIHILWINLVTDTFPAMALGMEEAESEGMKRPPRNPKESLFAGGLGWNILYQGVLIAILTLISFFIGYAQSHVIGMTMAFLTLSMCEIFHSMNMRSLRKSIFTMGTHNWYLWLAMLGSFLMTIVVIYVPGLNSLFRLVALSGADFLIAIGLAVSVIPIVEIIKLIQRSFEGRGSVERN